MENQSWWLFLSQTIGRSNNVAHTSPLSGQKVHVNTMWGCHCRKLGGETSTPPNTSTPSPSMSCHLQVNSHFIWRRIGLCFNKAFGVVLGFPTTSSHTSFLEFGSVQPTAHLSIINDLLFIWHHRFSIIYGATGMFRCPESTLNVACLVLLLEAVGPVPFSNSLFKAFAWLAGGRMRERQAHTHHITAMLNKLPLHHPSTHPA